MILCQYPAPKLVLALFLAFGVSLPTDARRASQEKGAQKASPSSIADFSNESHVVEENFDRWSFESDGTGTRELKLRVRIQSDAGVQRFGLFTLPYEKSSETLEVIAVNVLKPDGSKVTTSAEDFQDMASSISREAPFYSDTREKHVPVKGLRAGDVLEIQARWLRTKALVPGHFWLSMQFDRNEIILSHRIQVSVPRQRTVKVKSTLLAPVVMEEGARRVYTWSRSNLERPVIQKLELAQQVVRGRLPAPDVQISTFASWEEVGRWYEQLQRERIVPTAEIKEKAIELTRSAADPAAKVKALYRFVSTEYRYIGVAFGIGRYQPHFAAQVLNNQYGDCKDKHTLLAALLSAVGVPAYPALVNSAGIVDPDVPSPGQFNHVITMVPLDKGGLWLDTTAEVSPFGYLIPVLREKQALVAYPEKAPAFENTPVNPPFPALWSFKIDAQLDDTGTLKGRVEQTVRGDLEVHLRAALRGLPRTQWKDLIQQISYSTGFAGEVSDVIASAPESTELPLTFSYTYTRKDYPDWNGRRISPPAPAMLITPPEENGKLPSSFWLGAPGEFIFESKVQLPEGWAPQPPPKLDILHKDLIEYHVSHRREGNSLVSIYRMNMKGREVTGSGVGEYKAFAEKVQKHRGQFIALSSSRPQTAEEAISQFQSGFLHLPDSENEEALAAESGAREVVGRGSPSPAIEKLQRAVQLDPKFTRAWIFLAQIQLAFARQLEGIDSLRKAVESNPQEPLSYKMLAFALTSTDQRTEAIQVWQDLAKVAPDDRDVPTNMGSLLRAEGRYHDAIPYLERAVELYPKQIRVLSDLAFVYLKDNRDEKAKELFEKILALSPDAGAKNDIAYQLAVADKNLETALLYAKEAVADAESKSSTVQLADVKPEDLRNTLRLASFWDTLGWVHYRLGNFSDAEQYLHAAWAIFPNPTVSYHFGMVLEKLQRRQDALRMYRLASGQQSFAPDSSSQLAQKRMEALVGVAAANRPALSRRNAAGEELSNERSISLPRLVQTQVSAEFYVLLAPGPKVEDAKFISGSEALKSAGEALTQARFKAPFPEKSSARIVRRGILACYPAAGCSFVLFPIESVNTVE